MAGPTRRADRRWRDDADCVDDDRTRAREGDGPRHPSSIYDAIEETFVEAFVASLFMGGLDIGGLWCPNCGAEYRPGFLECPDCRVPLTAVKPPARPLRSTEGDHDELAYDLTGWGDDRRGALALMLTGAAIPHGWEGDILVVPHLREAEVDELIDSIEEAEPAELPADSTVRPQIPTGLQGQQSEHTPYLAGPGRRLLGFLLDAALLTAVSLIVHRLFDPGSRRPLLVSLAMMVLVASYQIVTIARWGRTIGKTVVGTRVVAATDHSTPGWRRATLRWAVVVGPLFVTVWLPRGIGRWIDPIVGNVWMIVVYVGVLRHPLRQGLHDRVAGTLVVEDITREPTSDA